MVAISMAVERVVEILKGIIPPLASTWTGDKEYFRFVILHILATVAGAGIAYGAHGQIADQVPVLSFKDHPYLGYAVIGLMSSGGSAMWNHALDIAQAMKIKQTNAVTIGK